MNTCYKKVCVSDYFMVKFIVAFTGVTLILLASVS